MSLHSLFGRRVADTGSRCTLCDLPMVKLPGLDWRLRAAVG